MSIIYCVVSTRALSNGSHPISEECPRECTANNTTKSGLKKQHFFENAKAQEIEESRQYRGSSDLKLGAAAPTGLIFDLQHNRRKVNMR
jgi:hypothetical protein